MNFFNIAAIHALWYLLLRYFQSILRCWCSSICSVSEFKGESVVRHVQILVAEVHEWGGMHTRSDLRKRLERDGWRIYSAQGFRILAVFIILVTLRRHLHDLIIDIKTVSREELDVQARGHDRLIWSQVRKQHRLHGSRKVLERLTSFKRLGETSSLRIVWVQSLLFAEPWFIEELILSILRLYGALFKQVVLRV